MTTPKYTIACFKKENVARATYDLEFEKPAGFSFQPGQFVLFSIPLVEHPEDIQTRALSIASTPDESHLRFAMKMQPGGRISRWIEEILRPGVTVEMQGPFGFFLLDRDTPKEYLFIATSTGVAPFRSQIKSALSADDRRRMDLVLGVYGEEDLFWQEELTALAQRHENFFLHCALSDPSDAWKGHRGWVQSLVPQIVRDFSGKSVYICGNPAMTKDVKQLCLTQWGIPKTDVHAEGYI